MGKTAAGLGHQGAKGKHPHGRGEDRDYIAKLGLESETPPRAWGRQPVARRLLVSGRNTPTGVGKTKTRSCWRSLRRKHPHGRGEDHDGVVEVFDAAETPPRAWGRPMTDARRLPLIGNTPTGVGKTLAAGAGKETEKKHPHGRGEDLAYLAGNAHAAETPPRAWGRR